MPWMFRPRVGPMVYRPSRRRGPSLAGSLAGAGVSVTLLVVFLIAVVQR